MDSCCGAWCWLHASWKSIPVPHCITGLPVTHILTVFVSQSIPGHVDQQLRFLLYRNGFQSSKINQTRNLASYPYSTLTLSFKKMNQKTLQIHIGGHANYFQSWESRFASFLLPLPWASSLTQNPLVKEKITPNKDIKFFFLRSKFAGYTQHRGSDLETPSPMLK